MLLLGEKFTVCASNKVLIFEPQLMNFSLFSIRLRCQIVKMHLKFLQSRFSKFSQIYKVKNNICPKHIVDLFQRTNTKYPLRNNTLIKYDFTWRKAFITYIGPKVRNLLPKRIRDLPKLFVFKQHIRQLDQIPCLLTLSAQIELYVVRNKHITIFLRSSYALVNSFFIIIW